MQNGRADAALDPRPLELNSPVTPRADSADPSEAVKSGDKLQGAVEGAQEVKNGGDRTDDGRSDVVERLGETRQIAQDAQQASGAAVSGAKEGSQGDRAGAQAGSDPVPEPAVAAGASSSTTSGLIDGASTSGTHADSQAGATGADAGAASVEFGAESAPAEIVLAAPKPSNPAAIKNSLLLQADGRPSPTGSPAGSVASGTPPPTATGTASILDDNGAARASPAPSASSATGSTTADKPAGVSSAPVPVKKFSSSLSVNKKFLEKAGEKAKPEVKPVATRLATPPAPTPASSTHPRLFAGKLSSTGTLSLSTTPSVPVPAGWKKPTSPAPPSTNAGQASSTTRPGSGGSAGLPSRTGPAVWGSAARAAAAAQGGLGRMANDFPTAAEAAHAKEMRAKLLLEQMQARERAEQARAAAAAAKNAHLLEELDAFRGKHLDPNAHHWDEDDDDFLDTTIEFADGTQYKIEQQAQADSAAASVVDEELREPGPGELALREKPLAPGEVVEQPKREERFGDDFDRSWPRRPSAPGDGRNLFNERIGRLEPAASGKRPAAPEPSSILRPRERRPSDVPPHLEPKHRRPSVTSPKASHAPLHPAPSASARRPSVTEPKPNAWGRRPSVGVGERQPPPHMSAPGGRQLPPHMQAAQPQSSTASAGKARGPLSPPLQRQPLPSTTATLRSPPAQAPPALVPAPAKSEGMAAEAAPAEAAAPISAPAEPVPNLEEMHAREMHAAAERAKKRREEEEQKRLEQIERAKRKAAELEEKMKAADEAKAEARRQEREAKAKSDAAAKAAVKAAPVGPPTAGSAADKVSSWRTGPRPAVGAQKQPIGPSATSSARILAREAPQPPPSDQAQAKPTAILARPSTSNSQASTAAPSAPSTAWRRPEASQPRAARQKPPHLANAEPAAAKDMSADAQGVAKTAAAPPADHPARSATPPPIVKGDVASPPASPMHKRGDSQGGTGKAGYKLPAVSQLDDLMSRIKGAMVPPGDGEVAIADGPAAGHAEAPRVKLPAASAVDSATVKLPARGPAAQTLPTTRGRGRGRGRPDFTPPKRPAAPEFEDREPQLPFHSSRTARSHSPPPAWKQYVVRLAAQPPRRRPQARQIRNFETLKYPQPLYPFSWSPVLRDANPRRLSRDDMLLPKRYTANGVPIFPVRLAPRTVMRKTAAGAKDRPTPTVSISRRALVRSHDEPQPAPPVEDLARVVSDASQTGAKPIHAVFGAPALTTAFASDDSTRSSSWRLPATVNGQSDGPESANSLSRTSGTPTFGMTGDLNGEKIEATPRRETSAPGLDAAALRMNPKSPPFQPSDLANLAATPASAAWPNKSLALSVLDPTAPSVWSTAPAENTVRIRTMSAVQPENSLQGLMDDDPSEVLPNSLAELKSDDGQSTEAQEAAVQEARLKDDARMRTMGPAAFSSFLHESAAAIDSTPLAAQRIPYYGDSALFPNGLEGHPPASPMHSYAASQAYSAIYASSRAFGQPMYPGYPVGASAASPYATNGYPSVYSAHPYPSGPSPVPQIHGYAIRDTVHSGMPLGITNPALMATYGYGQPAPRYGAVGANGPASTGRPTHNHSSPYARGSMQTVPPTSFISAPYASAYQPMAIPQQGYRPASPFGTGSHGSPPQSARLPGPSSTMASPVIVPQQLPPVPSFGMAVSPRAGYQQSPSMTSPHARPAGLPPHSGMHSGGYGSHGGRPNGAVPAGRGGPRGW